MRIPSVIDDLSESKRLDQRSVSCDLHEPIPPVAEGDT
jgi:hypothetical protein